MVSSTMNSEEMYARLALEEEEEGGICIVEAEIVQPKQSFILVGRFLTERNINFLAMRNVFWLRCGDLKKGLRFMIWEVRGMLTEKILQSIGNFVGVFVKSDPLNLNGMWKPSIRMRVTMDIGKPLKCRMKLKREGGDWNWINFKHERLRHSDRDCEVVYANTGKVIERAYVVWLRAPNKMSKTRILELDGYVMDMMVLRHGIPVDRKRKEAQRLVQERRTRDSWKQMELLRKF
ncbi:hypothetical protein POM88_025515 [Heracleum sosnowskyi]|uniref:Zinc knuckle CX2CX4HX4C domain-containing protein n=1 Tax=Heracleum sosnowskyi TaxID=360622 RepID=A0AAD8I4B1_9APIA|nr:hypothetical protein POM88_025515 [Heracleum sosnowskyi]